MCCECISGFVSLDFHEIEDSKQGLVSVKLLMYQYLTKGQAQSVYDNLAS